MARTGASSIGGAPAFVGTITLVVLSIVGFLFFDLSLAAIDRRESAGHAASSYEEGLGLLRVNQPAAAIEQFRTAVTIDRTNVGYALALAEAFLRAGRLTDAESTLKVLLTRTENDGAVNLTMAHVVAREGRINDAKAYFHRAVFGRWGADSTVRRAQARFELIDLVARHGTAPELLAELLPLEDVPADSTALRLRLGNLFLRAGSPARAANMFRGVLRREPQSADAFAGMGESALSLGNIRTARIDFSEASRLRPDDARLRARAALADMALRLDPTGAELSPAERRDRAHSLLGRTVAALVSCGEVDTPAMAGARALIAGQATRNGASYDVLVNAAIDLWSGRSTRCDALVHDEALRVLQRHLAS